MRLYVLLLSLVTLQLVYNVNVIECKRSGGGRSKGRSSSGSSTFWNRKKTSSSSSSSSHSNEPKPVPNSYPKQETAAKPAPAPKPSAPVQEHAVKKEQAGVQQSSPDQKPIGWNVNQPATNQNAYKTAQAPPPYSPNGPGGQPPSPYNSYGQAPPPYSAHGQAPPPYSPNGQYPQQNMGYGNNYQQSPMGGPPPAYSPYGHHPIAGAPPGYSQYPQNGMQMGGMGNNMGGMGYNNMGGMGYNNMGYNNPQKSGGLLGGIFGGNKGYRNGYGGYGGYGGMGGYGGYGMKKSGGFFGKHAFRNILGGMVLWYVVSGLFRKPYTVYNYYNQPETTENIQLPANILTLCDENSTNICVPGSTAICTTNSTILCVTTMNAAVPCPEQNQALCVNSTIPCADKNDPLCQNATLETNTTNINLPCFANVTVDVNLIDYASSNGSAKTGGQDYSYCVTTMAIPGPEELDCPEDTEVTNSTVNPSCIKSTTEQTSVQPPDFGMLNGTDVTYLDKTINDSITTEILPNSTMYINETLPLTSEAA